MKSRITSQKETVSEMIKLYCAKKHGLRDGLCPECLELMNYAMARLDNCRFGEDKPACRDCTVHCYKKDMKEKIIEVMRYSGPRMIIYNPGAVLVHFTDKFRNK